MEVDEELQTLLAEQRRELTAALAAESDLDFAFKLQMQEAMNDSLSVRPSSSSSAQQFHLPNDSVSNSSMAHLLAEEIEKFERERSDREQVEVEMTKLREDLSRRFHDRAFAREMHTVPEAEWKKTGDYFQKPYGEGSSATATNGEIFKLYCKGVVSEETVGKVKKMLAGIGVAICDSRDSAIFQLRKPLVGGDTSGETAVVKALIEGLNAAVTLGLKRITIFCDDNTLYQYVTGKRVARQGKIGSLVDQMISLQRKFTRCSPSLVARKDIKYAFKLARDAIVSQVTRPVESSSGINLIETCIICLEDTDVNQMLSDGCQHRYCFSCMKRHVEVKLLQGMLPRCPHEGCKFELEIESCRKFLTPELFDIMSQRIKEASVPPAQKLYCPYPRCSALMSKVEVNPINSIAGGAERAGARKCTKCHGLFCINCKVPWHSNMTCYDYKKLNPYPCAEEAKLKSLATKKLWRQCVICHHMIELKEGCYHISCRCGYEFCYTCGAKWKNKKATCACPIWAEPNILYDEPNRRRQRRQ